MRLPPRTAAYAASNELPLSSRGELLVAVALLTALALWAAQLTLQGASYVDPTSATARPPLVHGAELPRR